MSNDTKRTIGWVAFALVFYGALFTLLITGWVISDERTRLITYATLASFAMTPFCISLYGSIEKRLFPKTKEVRD